MDTFALKVEELVPVESRLNKTLGDIELQLTMNSITQQRIGTQFAAIEKRRQVPPIEEIPTTNEGRMRKLAQDGRTKANEQKKQTDELNKKLSMCVIESSKAMDHLNDILLRPPLRVAQIESDMDYTLMSETAQKLVGEAKRTKADLDSQYEQLQVATNKLKNFKFNHDAVDKHINTAGDKLTEISNYVIRKKIVKKIMKKTFNKNI